MAIVTGAGSGLGRAAAVHLAKIGYSVAAFSLVPEEIAALEEEARRAGSPVCGYTVDVGEPEQVEAAVRSVLQQAGKVDLLINNAGVIVLRPIEEMSVGEWDLVVRTNLRSAFLLSRELVPMFKRRRRGLIVNVSSQSGIKGFVGEAGYCPSKHGLEGLTKTLALELRSSGVYAVSVTPGAFMNTAMSLITLGPEQRAQWHDPAELAPGFSVLARQVGPAHSGRRYDLWKLAQTGRVEASLAA